MTDRRAFIQGSASLLALSALPLAAVPPEPRLPSFADLRYPLVVLVDRDLDPGTAAEAVATGHRVFGFRSDVARVWMNEIEPRLRAGPLGIAGYTSAATLFCLQVLAQDYGARVVQRVPHASGVTWLIATSPAHRAPLAPIRS